ncbi:sulfotransferase family 2 domain-containing protein [Paramylibacter ulvae]|uniref:sulfotransferase family 2 domain-containing protein n=1 Tax=Paramylibacter ulvae TaxID=1651968 RepID=UPI001E5B3753|nr:sulfotransferase family 2 domain-containing protein [Amylibacter ulvae]
MHKQSHVYPREKLSERYWLNCFSIAAVRHPFDRFISGYFYHVLGPYMGGLVKAYGPMVKDLDPFQYLALIEHENGYIPAQTNWTHFPSVTKPRVDLLLRVEEADKWMEQFKNAGLDMTGRRMHHENQSDHATDTRRERLNLSVAEFSRLRDEVFESYKNDYEIFGYDK